MGWRRQEHRDTCFYCFIQNITGCRVKILRNLSSVSRLIHYSSSLKICLICYSFVFNLSCVENKKHLCVIYCRSETKHFSQKPELNITLILHKFYPFQYPVLPPPLLYTFTFISFNSILLNKTLHFELSREYS